MNGEDQQQAELSSEVAPLVAPTPGTAILSTATIDSLFTLVFGTRSADLAATPTYAWSTGNQIMATWPSVTNNYSMIICTFQARSVSGSSIVQ
jgi:hypothetical protein